MSQISEFHTLTLEQKDAVGRVSTYQILNELTYELPSRFNLEFSSSAHHAGREKLAKEWQKLGDCELSTRMEISFSMTLERVFKDGLYSAGKPTRGKDVRRLVNEIRVHIRNNNPWPEMFLLDSAENAYSRLNDRLDHETEFWPAREDQCE